MIGATVQDYNYGMRKEKKKAFRKIHPLLNRTFCAQPKGRDQNMNRPCKIHGDADEIVTVGLLRVQEGHIKLGEI